MFSFFSLHFSFNFTKFIVHHHRNCDKYYSISQIRWRGFRICSKMECPILHLNGCEWLIRRFLRFNFLLLSPLTIFHRLPSFQFQLFAANTDSSSVSRHELDSPVRASFFRFYTRQWHNNIALRIELYGCRGNKEFLDKTQSVWDMKAIKNKFRGWMERIHLPAISQKCLSLIDNCTCKNSLKWLKRITMKIMILSCYKVLYIHLIYTETIILFALDLNAKSSIPWSTV